MDSRRQKKVASVIQNELSQLFVESFQDSNSGLISITRVEMSKDLKTAQIYISVFESSKSSSILELLNARKGYLRKSIASKTKLKYNPMIIFYPDFSLSSEKKIDEILEKIKKNAK